MYVLKYIFINAGGFLKYSKYGGGLKIVELNLAKN